MCIRDRQREDHFDITVASEIMAIVCLSNDIFELREKLGNIIVGYNEEDKPIYAKDLKAQGAMAVLLKDAIKPNLVQTLEHTPALIHGGPFANIAHGCNSIRATKLALKLSDYTITESGFGADLGAEKFLDIKCKKFGIKPDAFVLVTTIKALKYHGGVEKKNIQKENIEAKGGAVSGIGIPFLLEKYGIRNHWDDYLLKRQDIAGETSRCRSLQSPKLYTGLWQEHFLLLPEDRQMKRPVPWRHPG